MHKREVAQLLRAMGALLEIKGEAGFKVRAYDRAARTIERGDFPLLEMATSGRLSDIPNVGKNLEPKIRELILTGSSSYLENLTREVPLSLLDLLKVPGIGPKTARILYERLGVAGLDDLQEALETQKVQFLPGMGKKRQDEIAAGLREIRENAGSLSLGIALPVAEDILASLASKDVSGILVGELGRGLETVSALEILLELRPEDTPVSLVRRSGIIPVRDGDMLERSRDAAGEKLVFSTGLGIPLVFHFAQKEDFWPRAIWLTGPKEYIERLVHRGSLRGLCFDSRGLFRDSCRVFVEDEESFFELMDSSRVPPEVRHREEFLALAEAGESIHLVGPQDLKGDLHTHTVWSDGMDSVEAMVIKGITMGYSYMAITDHATFMKMIGGVTPENIDAYLEDITEVQERHPDFRVLAGVEVDVAKDGSLYLGSDDLARFDLVVASVHQDISNAGDLVGRLTKACENPHVDIIGHPTGRLLGSRPGVTSGLEPVFEAAARCGTMLEINASPDRIDLPETLVRRAYDLGAGLVVSSDAHGPGTLENVRYGVVASPRRAGLPPKGIKNTLKRLPRLLCKFS